MSTDESSYTGSVAAGGPAAVRPLSTLVIRKASVGPMDNNAYLLTCRVSGAQLLIDAAADPDRLMRLVREGSTESRLDTVVTTHSHHDHIGALGALLRTTGARAAAGVDDIPAIEEQVPTTFEPAGIVHVEAAAAGVPSIGSALGGAADMIGPSGVTVEPGSVDSLVDAMRCLADGATARAMGEAGLERAGLFTWEKVAARILQAAGAMPRDHALWDGLFEVSAALASG